MRNFEEQTNPRICALETNSGGFTLIEVLIAAAVFSIGFLAAAALVFSTTHNNTKGNVVTQATMLASQKIEELRSTPDVTSLESGADPGPIDEQGNPGGIFTRSWTVSDPLVSSTTRQIQVTVSCDRLGNNRSVVMATLVRGNGI